jgi:hypothetical protein
MAARPERERERRAWRGEGEREDWRGQWIEAERSERRETLKPWLYICDYVMGRPRLQVDLQR